MLDKFVKSEFSKNVLTLMSGTMIAQLIPIAMSPILMRLYTPEDFGLFSLFASTVSILSVIAAGRYEEAIIVSKSLREAKYSAVLSMILTLLFSIFTFIALGFIYLYGSDMKFVEQLDRLIFFIPLVVFLASTFKILYAYENKKKMYKLLSTTKVLQSFLSTSFNLILALTPIKNIGLIIAQILTQTLLTIYIWIKSGFKLERSLFSPPRLLHIIKKYQNFPKYDTFTAFLNSLSLELPIFLLSYFFSPLVVGLFMLSRRIVGLPIVIASASITAVFREKATEDYHKYGNCNQIFMSTLKKLIIIALPPSIILFLFAPEIFGFVFGDKWVEAGVITQILVPMFLLRLIATPLSYLFYIVGKQKLNLIGQALLVAGIVLVFVATAPFNNYFLTLILFSIVFSIYYLAYIYLSYKFSKGLE